MEALSVLLIQTSLGLVPVVSVLAVNLFMAGLRGYAGA